MLWGESGCLGGRIVGVGQSSHSTGVFVCDELSQRSFPHHPAVYISVSSGVYHASRIFPGPERLQSMRAHVGQRFQQTMKCGAVLYALELP